MLVVLNKTETLGYTEKSVNLKFGMEGRNRFIVT